LQTAWCPEAADRSLCWPLFIMLEGTRGDGMVGEEREGDYAEDRPTRPQDQGVRAEVGNIYYNNSLCCMCCNGPTVLFIVINWIELCHLGSHIDTFERWYLQAWSQGGVTFFKFILEWAKYLDCYFQAKCAIPWHTTEYLPSHCHLRNKGRQSCFASGKFKLHPSALYWLWESAWAVKLISAI
jgi:hypothetical protein